MTELVVRRLLVDLQTPFDKRWNGGDAFRSAYFNALSMSFPAGEQVFIDSVRVSIPQLPERDQARWADEVQAFVGQEATHRRIHQLFNDQLLAQGFANHWEPRILRRRQRRLEGLPPRAWLGVTAATEHLTAIFAEHLLAHPQTLQGAEPRLRDLWLWHASEESEHRCTAFDLYRAVGGNEVWRRRLFVIVTWHFLTDLARQTLNNLWHDGSWWRASTWASAWTLLFGRVGVLRQSVAPWWRYLREDFHPSQGDGAAGKRWLSEHAALAPPVRAPQVAA